MCSDCRYWLLAQVVSEHKTLLAPCELKPPRRVSDPRMPGGFDVENFWMAADHSCPRFAKRAA